MVTKDYFVRLSVDAAQLRLGLMSPNQRQEYLDAYQSVREIDLKNPPPLSDPRCASQLEEYFPETASTHLVGQSSNPTAFKTNATSSPVSPAGWILVIIGSILLLAAYTYDVSAGGYGLGRDVANLDKMSFRMMLLSTGLASIIAGTLCLGFAKVVHALNLLQRTQGHSSV